MGNSSNPVADPPSALLPERIWCGTYSGRTAGGFWGVEKFWLHKVEYVRADLAPAPAGVTDLIARLKQAHNLLGFPQAIALCREAADQLAALTPQDAAVAAWRDIETAPRDGTTIIGWSEYMLEPCTIRFLHGHWRSVWDQSEVIEYMSDFGSDYKDPNPVTHWQPMPYAPAIRTGGK